MFPPLPNFSKGPAGSSRSVAAGPGGHLAAAQRRGLDCRNRNPSTLGAWLYSAMGHLAPECCLCPITAGDTGGTRRCWWPGCSVQEITEDPVRGHCLQVSLGWIWGIFFKLLKICIKNLLKDERRRLLSVLSHLQLRAAPGAVSLNGAGSFGVRGWAGLERGQRLDRLLAVGSTFGGVC